jgi:hypothetical protein
MRVTSVRKIFILRSDIFSNALNPFSSPSPNHFPIQKRIISLKLSPNKHTYFGVVHFHDHLPGWRVCERTILVFHLCLIIEKAKIVFKRTACGGLGEETTTSIHASLRPISLHSHVILAKIQKRGKAKNILIPHSTHLAASDLRKSEENFHLPQFPPCSSTSRIHNSTSYCRQRSKATRKIENENHLLARLPTSPTCQPTHLLNNIVFLLLKQFIIARWLVDSQTHTHEDGNLL